jgi:hypothetical protein
MKNLSVSASFLLGLVTVSLQAGEPVEYKQVAPPPPELYGVGFYGAIDMGANVFQNFGDKTFTQDDRDLPFFGSSLDLHPEHDVGIFGGIKPVTFLARVSFDQPWRAISFTTVSISTPTSR